MSEDNTVTTVAPTADTGTASTASADTSQPASPATMGDAGSQPAPGTDDQGSLTSGETNVPSKPEQPIPGAETSTSNQPVKPSVDWEKRYRDQQSWHDKRYTQTQTEVQKLQQQLQEQSRWRQEQERKATLQPWDRQHPDGAKFN